MFRPDWSFLPHVLTSKIIENGREENGEDLYLLKQGQTVIIGNKESKIYPKESEIPPSRSLLFARRIEIESPWITRNHCKIIVKKEFAHITIYHPSARVKVNDQLLTPDALGILRHGTKLEIGKQLYRYTLQNRRPRPQEHPRVKQRQLQISKVIDMQKTQQQNQ